MKARPEFTVIAGPNGAGKSRLCHYYIRCKSFDGDLLAMNLREEHPEWAPFAALTGHDAAIAETARIRKTFR